MIVAVAEEESNAVVAPMQTAARETCTYLSPPEGTRRLGK